jgi:DNA-binding response OmpR family regulator
VNGSPVDLTPLEFRLLAFLMERPGRVLTRDQLLEQVWGEDVFVTDRTVDTHIKRLRSKLGSRAERVETIRGVGYRFRE